MVRNANRRRRQLVSRRLSMTPLTVAATLLGMSELALAGDGAVDAARPYPGDNGAKSSSSEEDGGHGAAYQITGVAAQAEGCAAGGAEDPGCDFGRQAARQSEQDARPRRRSGRRPFADTPPPRPDGGTRQRGARQTAAPDQADKSAKSAKAAKPDTLEKAGDKAILGLTDSPIPGLAIGAYGEMLFGAAQNPAAGGQWQGGADIRRMVLLPTYAITDNIIFNAELEWEHGGFSRWGRQGERRNRRRAAVDRFQDRRSVQLAGAGNRPRSDRLHQPASRADAVLQRAAAGNIQRPHPFDLDGAVEQRLWLDRRRTGLSDHGVEQPRGFRRRLQHAYGC